MLYVFHVSNAFYTIHFYNRRTKYIYGIKTNIFGKIFWSQNNIEALGDIILK